MPRSGATVTMITGMWVSSGLALRALRTAQPSVFGINTSSVIASGLELQGKFEGFVATASLDRLIAFAP